MEHWKTTFKSVIARTSADLPADVESVLMAVRDREGEDTNARRAMDVILENIELARGRGLPLCQDTGTLLFWLRIPVGVSRAPLVAALAAAIAESTAAGILRQNSVDSVSGRNSGTNLGAGSPVIHWEEAAPGEDATIGLILKGGGCENVGCQYSLPDTGIGADRDLDGVRRCVLDAVIRAQGYGCSPGVLAVIIGGDRATGYAAGKRLLLRRLGVRSRDPELAALECRLLADANQLGIGPMGFGGCTTVLDVFAGALNRVPASYFVSICYMCWAYRRRIASVTGAGELLGWRDSWPEPV